MNTLKDREHNIKIHFQNLIVVRDKKRKMLMKNVWLILEGLRYES